MSDYNIELSSESINGSMNYKRKFNMSGDIGGSGGGVLVLHYDSDVNGVDKTWQEIYDAAAAGQVVLYQNILSETQATAWFLGNVQLYNGIYSVTFYQGEQSDVLYADSANEKPHYIDT